MFAEKLRNTFMKHVNMAVDHWLWTASKNKAGYGCFGISRKIYLAHRVSWMLFKGEIPEGQQVLHTCDIPSCVNPDCLFLGDHQINMKDRNNKGRNKTCGSRGDNNISRRYPERMCRGEKHPNSSLTLDKVNKIRERYRNGEKQVVLAKEYDVPQSNISCIVNNKTWKESI